MQAAQKQANWKTVLYGLFQFLFFLLASAAALYILWGGQLLASLVTFYETTLDILRFLIFIPIVSITLRYLERRSHLRFFQTNASWVTTTTLLTITVLTWHSLMVQNGWYWDLAQNQAGRAVIPLHFLFALAIASILLNYNIPTTFPRKAALVTALVVAGLAGYDNWENLRHIATISRPASDIYNTIADPIAGAMGSLAALAVYDRLVRRKQLLSKLLPVKTLPQQTRENPRTTEASLSKNPARSP